MDRDRDKRPPDEVLFKWDPRTHSMNFDTSSVTDDVFIKRRMTESAKFYEFHKLLNKLDENDAKELKRSFKDSTPDGLVMNPNLLVKNRDKRADLTRNLKKFQLHSCKDWLGTNTNKTCIEKVDTLDRLSSVIMNPEFPIKHEAVLYSMQIGKSDYDFYNALFATKLSRMSNPAVLELIRQPVFVRNRMLLLTDVKACNCPISVLTKQQVQQRHFLHQRASYLPKPMTPATQNQSFPQQQGGFGDSLFNRFVSPQTNLGGPSIFGGEKSYTQLFGLDKKMEAERAFDNIDENDIMCPFHVPAVLPESLKTPKGLCGVIEYYNLFYKYEEVKLASKHCHMLSLYSLDAHTGKHDPANMKPNSPSNKVYQYKLPSKLLAINNVYLRDFEYERYFSTYNLYNSGSYIDSSVGVDKDVYLSKVYSGDALFIVTKSEILIALVHFKKSLNKSSTSTLRLSVILRDNNSRKDVKEVLCHRQTGRIFMLESSSLLYEYQYQLGFSRPSLKEHRVFKHVYNTLRFAKHMVLNMVRSNRVYELNTRPPTIDPNELPEYSTHEGGRRGSDLTVTLSVDNCIHSMDTSVSRCTSYYPPIQWNEMNYSSLGATNLFRSTNTSGDSTTRSNVAPTTFRRDVDASHICTCGFGCRSNRVKRNLKCLNPWNKSFMKTGDSIAVLDENRWMLSLFNTTSGDLSVFHIHGYTALDEYTNSLAKHERVFPYDLTLYNLKHGSMLSTLDRLGYGRFSFGSKFVKILPAPMDFVQGVDLILVDTNGVKIFIGFSNASLTTPSSLITTSLATNLGANLTTETIKINAVNEKHSSNPSKVGLCVKGFRVPFRHVVNHPKGPFSLFRSKTNVTTFLLDNLFMTMEAVRKLQNGTLVRVTLTKNDSSSFFQNHTTLPLSINEEFYMFNENAIQYRTFEENQPLEYYHQFYIKLEEKEKIITTYHRSNSRILYPNSNSKWNTGVNYNVEANAENSVNLDRHLNNGETKRFDSVKNVDNVLYLVTTEKVYMFNRFNESLLLKLLVRYPKNTFSLIKPPPLMNSNTYGKTVLPNSMDPDKTMELVRFDPSMAFKATVADHSEEEVFNLTNFVNKNDQSHDLNNYFLDSLENNNAASPNWDSSTLQLANNANLQAGNFKVSPNGDEGLNRYLSRMNRSDSDELFFKNIFGDSLVELCENSNELIGYSLYYMSWLYGPENLFKNIFNYLTDILINNSSDSVGDVSYDSEDAMADYKQLGDLTGLDTTDALKSFVSSEALPSYSGKNSLSEYYGNSDHDLFLTLMNNNLLYNYLFTNSVPGYNAFIASFGIPYKIFNYVAPGCYSVCEDGFDKPVISPWCKFVSFNQNKVKKNRVTANTTPLVDGLILSVSESLSPMYYSRMFNVAPRMYTSTLTNPLTASAESSTPTSYSYFNPNARERPYIMDNLHVKRVENVNEFVVGERVDMYLTLELSMGLEPSKTLLKKLHSLYLLVMELIKDYQGCNLENVVNIMSTLAPNVVRMLLAPNVNQHEPYPTSQNPISFTEPPTTTTTFTNFYKATVPRDALHTAPNEDPINTESHEQPAPGAYDTRLNTDSKSLNKLLLSRLETLIRERYENDLRTLKELATVLQVSQEFLASAILLHNNTVLGEYDYEFDKNLNLLHLLPSKTPKSFFSPLDFNLNWTNENKFLLPFDVKFTHESPKSKLILTKTIIQLMAQSNLINLFMNKEFFKFFRIVVWLVGENVSTFQKHFFGHVFTFDEIGLMNNCNRVKFLQRHLENTDDVAKAEYLQSLIKQFTIH